MTSISQEVGLHSQKIMEELKQLSSSDIIICIMGPTSAGKSTLISLLTGQGVRVGDGLEACTSEVGIFRTIWEGRTVCFVDTPGFGNIDSDTDVLKEIVFFLSYLYMLNIKLGGVIYLHRITDIKMGGSALKSLRIFEALCGLESMSNIVLASTMWDKLQIQDSTHENGIIFERELLSNDKYWGLMVQKGSGVFRHDGSKTSAWKMVSYVLSRNSPIVLAIQTQMIDDKQTLDNTDAGLFIQQELLGAQKQHEKEIQELIEPMNLAIHNNNAELITALTQERHELESKIEQTYQEQKKLKADMKRILSEQRERYGKELIEMGKQERRYREELIEMEKQERRYRKGLIEMEEQEPRYREGLIEMEEQEPRYREGLIEMEEQERLRAEELHTLEQETFKIQRRMRDLQLNNERKEYRPNAAALLLKAVGGVVLAGLGAVPTIPVVASAGLGVLYKNSHGERKPLPSSSGKDESSVPAPMENVLKKSDPNVRHMQDNTFFVRLVDRTVRGAYRNFSDIEIYKATFHITWQLSQCVREELDGSPDLGPILTISGNSRHAWAVSCLEYVETTWHDVGRRFLCDLKTILGKAPATNDSKGQHTPTEYRLFDIDENATGFSRVLFKGTVSKISILAQFLCWIAATFRMPQVGELSCSWVNFKSVPNQSNQTPVFRIGLQEPIPLDEQNPGTCWKSLFPTTIMALNFPVPECPGIFGLQIPFGAMLEMADILYDVNLEDRGGNETGIYFDGVSWMLYPSAYVEDRKTIQWHLLRKPVGEEQNLACSPDDLSALGWNRIRDLETLSSATAVLGYCGEAVIQLGTEAQREQYSLYQSSLTKIENPHPDASAGTASLSVSALGFVTGQFAATFKARKGLRDAQASEKEMSYTDVLDRTEVEPVILFETEEGNERAWMVPQLCVILDLFNFWASRKGLDDIRYARRGPNGGAEARAILADREYANRVAIPKILHTESDVLIGDVVKQIYGRMRKRMATNAESDEGAKGTIRLGRAGMVGWDWLELTNLAWTLTRRREVRPARKILLDTKPCWMPLTKVVPVFFGQHMGELITPARPSEACRHWYPIPGGFENNYLAASVRCIMNLAAYYGHDRCWFLPENLVWYFKDESMFRPCVSCIADPKNCVKRPQALVPAVKKLHRKRPGQESVLLQVLSDGAVVFAMKRKDEKLLNMTRGREDEQQPVVFVIGQHLFR